MTSSDRLTAVLADRYTMGREIGAGGMATVYLAEDLKHHRKVALKVLRPELAAVLGPERFLSEIQTTANLQHPHLLPLFDSGEAGGLLFYVMPFVEGESLRHRLDRERQLPVEEAVRIAAAIASALDYAHRHGVVHRDLKPENILLHEGQPLVADFGIALAVSAAGGARVTQTGLSLGTPAYMSPEQATGDQKVDARSDQYALAAVTYEMLAGEPPHTAPTTQGLIAKLLTERARSVRIARPSVPEHVDASLQKALEKLPADRFATAGEFSEALQGNGTLTRAYSSAPHITTPRSRAMAYAPWLVAAFAVVAAVVLTKRPVALAEATVTQLLPPDDHTFVDGPNFAISPDGRRLAFVARAEDGSSALWVQRLDSLEATRLNQTEGAGLPFWSPDGSRIGFFSRGALRTMSASGESLRELCPTPDPRGGDWSSSGTIFYGPANGSPLYSVEEGGGPCSAIGTLPVSRPSLLPDGIHVLVETKDSKGIMDSRSGEFAPLPYGTPIFGAVFAAPNFILYGVQGETGPAVEAIPVELPSGAAKGAPRRLLPRLTNPRGFASLSASRNGVLIANIPRPGVRPFVWVDRRGAVVGDPVSKAKRWSAASSHDGESVVTAGWGMVLHDLDRRTETKLAVEADPGSIQPSEYPVWSPGDSLIAFGRGLTFGLWLYHRGDGSRELLHASGGRRTLPSDWSADGRTIFYTLEPGDSVGHSEIWQLDVTTRESRLVFTTPANVSDARLSPDSRWLAYVSDESGRREVYLRAYPGTGAPVSVSSGGGYAPRWRSDGSELFFLTPQSSVMSVSTDRLPRMGQVATVLRSEAIPGDGVFSVSPDGQRFLMTAAAPLANNALTVIHNWTARLNGKD